MIGFPFGLADVFLKWAAYDVRMPVIAKENFVGKVGGCFAEFAKDGRVWLAAKSHAEINMGNTILVDNNCTGASCWMRVDSEVGAVAVIFAEEDCAVGMLGPQGNNLVDDTFECLAINEIGELFFVGQVVGGGTVTVTER